MNQILKDEVGELKARLAEAEETLSAIYNREVDALIVAGTDGEGEQVYSLKGAETPYRLLVEAMNEGALALLTDGTIIYCNSRFAGMAQCPLERASGSSWHRFLPAGEHGRFQKLLSSAARGPSRDEFNVLAADGGLWPVQASVRSVALDGVEMLVVLLTDISQLKSVQGELLRARDNLEMRVRERTAELASANEILRAEMAERRSAERALNLAQKKLRDHAMNLEQRIHERTAKLEETVAELEAFSYSVSHDLRAPLRSIHSFSQLLLDESDGQLNEEQQTHLKRVVSNASRLDKLIQDVLAYSRSSPTTVQSETVDLDKLTRDIIQQYPTFQAPEAEICISGTLPNVLAHEASLTQCVSNLLGNAIKFVPKGVIPQVNIRADLLGAEARIWIEDNGIGIAPPDQVRIFNIFERIHSPEEFSGNGIGLSIVKRSIERMGGRVGVESDMGRGSRFWIKLLLAPNS